MIFLTNGMWHVQGSAGATMLAREPSMVFCGASSGSEREYEPLGVHLGILIPREDSHL